MFQWQKESIKRRYTIKTNDEIVGMLRCDSMLSSKAKAELNGRRYIIQVHGLFTKKVSITDFDTKEKLEVIDISLWHDKGKVINRPSEDIYWRYKNFFRTKWSWVNGSSEEMRFVKHFSVLADKGKVFIHEKFDKTFEYRILLGLYLRNYFLI